MKTGKVVVMAETKQHDGSNHELVLRHRGAFDRVVGDWPDVLGRSILLWPQGEFGTMRVEECVENDSYVIRIELPGIDTTSELDVRVVDDTLCVQAERRDDEESKGRDYVYREQRYGWYYREIPLPRGVSEADITAGYTGGVLEICIPVGDDAAVVDKRIVVTKD